MDQESRMKNHAPKKSSIAVVEKRFCFSRPASRGFGLVEIIIAIAIASLTLGAFLQVGVISVKLLHKEKENLEATLLAEEALEAVRSVRDESWTTQIDPLPNNIPYYPVLQGGKWILSAASPGLINGKYQRYVIFNAVSRNSADPGKDEISTSGSGVYDDSANTRKVIARVLWGTEQKELVSYITNYQVILGNTSEAKTIYYEGAATDGDLAAFPSDNAGNGDPAQSFATLTSSLQVTKVELELRRATAAPSDVFAEIRISPTGSVLGSSQTITGSSIPSDYSWVAFQFSNPIPLSAGTTYYIRLRSVPSSTDALSGSQGTIRWRYLQTGSSPYAGGQARRYIGRLSNPSDSGQALSQYDFGFRVYALQ